MTVGASSDGLATGLPGQSGTAKGAAVARTTKRSKQDIVECGVGEESEAGGVIGEVKAEETESSLLAFLGELQRFMQAHEAMVGGLGDLETKVSVFWGVAHALRASMSVFADQAHSLFLLLRSLAAMLNAE